ncbi:MAG: MurT ligase domain-containing protein [Candidatus Nomurabacteria bacterium]|jgi:UDP-N-acetylmuramyl tripeptide synthase|nr:MurT ligase domain-containing protein [Candidatus Nomurabacteria bacterium]
MIGSILLGKGIQTATRVRGNGGSALPGLVIERMNPKFVREILGKLKYGVVVISGTNGKTTTTKIVAELLEKQGLKVFTNDTGSNFVRGVISAIVKKISIRGKFGYDIAVLELDEAYAVKFAEIVPIEYVLLLNVQRDQLDRFGEIDHTAKLLEMVAQHSKKAVVINREDPRLREIDVKRPVYFGLSEDLMKLFPPDEDLPEDTGKRSTELPALVRLKKLVKDRATYEIDGKDFSATLKLKGGYNAYNAAGALALVKTILPKSSTEQFIADLSGVESAFGRGESFTVDGVTVELLLVKNPSAFQLSLDSFASDDYDYMIAINDNYADGRDVSWLYNVDFSKLKQVAICAGMRAYDMVLRLKYDEIEVDSVEQDVDKALRQFVGYSGKPKRIFATYTAMLEIRKLMTGKSLL